MPFYLTPLALTGCNNLRNLDADPFGPNQIPGLRLLRLDGPTHRVVDKSGVDLFSNLIESLPFFMGAVF